MSEENSSFDDLLRSPFEPVPSESSEPRRPDWWPAVAGVAIGAVAILIGYLLASGDSSTGADAITSTTVASTTTLPPTTAVTGDLDVAFPPGFVEVTDMIAVKPEYIIDAGDELVVAFVSASRRGFETGDSFDGGDWILETASGDELTASGTTTSVAVPGGFSVQFATDGDVTPERIRLLNRWEVNYRDGTLELPFTGVPFATGGHEVDLGGGVTLSLDRVSLGDIDGEIEWSLQGAGERGGVVDMFVSVGTETSQSAYYFDLQRTGFFDTGSVGDAATAGVQALRRQDENDSAQDLVNFEISVALIGILPADATFDLSETPGLGR